jgi:exodeoxyribonuclease VII small subunit
MSKKDEPTVAQKIEDFEAIIRWFQSDNFSLEQAMEQYQKAEKLSDEIEAQLSTLKHDITVLKQKFDHA